MQTISFEHAAQLLSDGQVGILPTDTVYGIVAPVRHPAAVTRLFQVKPRDGKPGTIIAASVDDLIPLGIARDDLAAVAGYWPGAISIVVAHQADTISQGLDTIAVRIPAGTALQQLLATTGPLMTSSANMPGEPTAQTIQEAIQYFGATVDFYVDGGDLSDRLSSTIVRPINTKLHILRPGSVQIKE